MNFPLSAGLNVWDSDTSRLGARDYSSAPGDLENSHKVVASPPLVTWEL